MLRTALITLCFLPLMAQFQKTIDVDLKADTKKLFATDIALRAVTEDGIAPRLRPHYAA